MSAAWVSAHWPAMLSAATHARQAAKSAVPPKFEFFSPEQAVEIEAISARIIPTTDTPGAREAGVVFFIDRALVTFGKANQKLYTEGLPDAAGQSPRNVPRHGEILCRQLPSSKTMSSNHWTSGPLEAEGGRSVLALRHKLSLKQYAWTPSLVF